jgi:hypothetical protein
MAKEPLVKYADGSPMQKAPKWLRVLLWIMAGIIALLLVIGFLPDPQPAAISPNGALQISLAELERAYDDNEAAAQLKFGSGPLIVTGKVAKVILGAEDQLIINMESEFLLPVGAPLDKADMAKAGLLKQGSDVTVLCRSVTEFMGKPSLENCRIYN